MRRDRTSISYRNLFCYCLIKSQGMSSLCRTHQRSMENSPTLVNSINCSYQQYPQTLLMEEERVLSLTCPVASSMQPLYWKHVSGKRLLCAAPLTRTSCHAHVMSRQLAVSMILRCMPKFGSRSKWFHTLCSKKCKVDSTQHFPRTGWLAPYHPPPRKFRFTFPLLYAWAWGYSACTHNVNTPGSWIFCEIPVLPTTDNLSWEAQVFHKESTFQALSCVYSCGWQGASDTGCGKCSAYNSHANIEPPPQAARERPLL